MRAVFNILYVVALLFIFSGAGYSNFTNRGEVSIRFHHFVNNDRLILDSSVYHNRTGQEFTISKFKYYVGHIELVAKNGFVFRAKNYFLINEEEPISKNIHVPNVPSAEYVTLNFSLGVDSIDNCSGAQSGALDPVNGMFWTWNSGYIFLKLDGKSPASSAPGHIFEYHIGGYKKPANCIRHISIHFTEPLVVRNGSTCALDVVADAMKIMDGQTNIDFKTLPVVSDNKHAEEIANNYAGMFRLKN